MAPFDNNIKKIVGERINLYDKLKNKLKHVVRLTLTFLAFFLEKISWEVKEKNPQKIKNEGHILIKMCMR